MEAGEAHLGNITSAFSQYSGANSFKKNKSRFKGLFMKDFIYRFQPMWNQTSVMTSEELATVFHFPNKSITTPHIMWLNSKRAPAPEQIQDSGLFLGKRTYRCLYKNISMPQDYSRRAINVFV